jgi:Skp family chaperone for outer membrane proteins
VAPELEKDVMSITNLARAAALALAVVAVPWTALPATAQMAKLAVFDPQRVSEETALGKRVQARLKAFQEVKQGEIDAKEQKIKDLQRELSEKALSLSADKRGEMERDIQRRALDLQSAREAATREFQLEIQSAQNEFQEKLIVAVEAFGRDEGLDLILDASLAAWSTPGVDVTTAIIDRFDRMFPVEQAKTEEPKEPAAAAPKDE